MWMWFLGFALACGVVLAQGPAPSGSYGVLFTETQLDSFGRTGVALVGTLNFESGGKVTVSVTAKGRSTIPGAQTLDTFTGSGSYSQNENGTFLIKFEGDDDTSLLAMPFENGKGLYFLDADCFGCGSNIPFVIRGETMIGSLPVSLVIGGAGLVVPVTLTRMSGPQARVAVFSAGGASASSTVPMCSDGASGTFTAEVGILTVAFQQEPPERGGFVTGNFFASMNATICGQTFQRNTSGLATGNVNAAGVTNLQLLARPGEVGSGFGRTAGGTVRGTYAL